MPEPCADRFRITRVPRPNLTPVSLIRWLAPSSITASCTFAGETMHIAGSAEACPDADDADRIRDVGPPDSDGARLGETDDWGHDPRETGLRNRSPPRFLASPPLRAWTVVRLGPYYTPWGIAIGPSPDSQSSAPPRAPTAQLGKGPSGFSGPRRRTARAGSPPRLAARAAHSQRRIDGQRRRI